MKVALRNKMLTHCYDYKSLSVANKLGPEFESVCDTNESMLLLRVFV